MKIFWIFLKVFPCIISGLELSKKDTEIKLIVDISESYDKPTFITAFLCLDPYGKAELTTQLRNLRRPIRIGFVNRRKNLLFTEKMQHEHNTLFVANLKCPGVSDILHQAQKNKMFNNPFRWLIIGDISKNSSNISFQLDNVHIMLDSEVIIALKNISSYFEINSIYKINEKDDWILEHYGTWSEKSGYRKIKTGNLVPVLRRRNLAGKNISVAFNIDDKDTGVAVENYDDRIRNSRHSVTQWGFLQILVLFEFMNATRVNVITDDWGYYVNGSWNGIIGKMVHEEVELSGTPIFMSKRRAEHANYLINPIQTMVKFVFREPPLSYQNNLFLLPFASTVWCTLAGLVVILVVVIYANARWEWEKANILRDNSEDDTRNSDKLSLSDVVMLIVGAISQQGSFVELKSGMGRLVMFILFLAFLFLFTAYSASIVALLQSSSKQIRTLSDLLNSKLELGVENTSYNIYYFTKATDPVRKAIYELKVAPRGLKPKFMSAEEGVKRLQKHPFAFNMDVGVGYKVVEKYFYEHEKCGLQEIAYVPPQKPWMTCRKNSPYKELIKIGLYRIHEHGISHRANRLVFTKKPVCAVKGASFDSVSIVDVYPSLFMLFYGMLLAVALLAMEIFAHRHQMKKEAIDKVADSINN